MFSMLCILSTPGTVWVADMTCQPECIWGKLLQDIWCKLLQDMWCKLLQDMWCKLLQNKRHFRDIAMKKRISALNNERLLLNIEPSLRYLLHDVQVG